MFRKHMLLQATVSELSNLASRKWMELKQATHNPSAKVGLLGPALARVLPRVAGRAEMEQFVLQ
eukprot:1809136-Rhodomonas_salina.1